MECKQFLLFLAPEYTRIVGLYRDNVFLARVTACCESSTFTETKKNTDEELTLASSAVGLRKFKVREKCTGIGNFYEIPNCLGARQH
jgi:hypothetical protein